MWDRTNGPILRTAYGVLLPDGQMGYASINAGCIPGSRLAASVQPTAADTVVIGGKTFTFVAALGAAAANLQVLRGANAAAAYANLVDAINGKASTKDATWRESTTPFALTVVADMVTATQLRLRWATARGGLPMAAVAPSTVLTAAITGGASAWSEANLNANGKSPQDMLTAYGAHVVTSAEVTAGFVDLELEFQPMLVDIHVTTSLGALKSITEQTTTPANQNSLHLTIGTGGTPLAAGDVITWWVAA